MRAMDLRSFVCALCVLSVTEMGSNWANEEETTKAQGNVVEPHFGDSLSGFGEWNMGNGST